MPEAQAALAACLGYFRRVEPSSPAVLLIGQAQRLIGKSLIEVIQIMFPDHVDKAMLEIGTDPKFQLPLERLGGDGYGGSGDEAGSGYDDGDAYDDSASSGEDEDGSSMRSPAATEEAAGDEGEEAEASQAADETGADDGQAQPEPEPEAPAPAIERPAVPAITVASRAEAIARMKAVAGFYRHAEPSNPVPLLMDKACALAQQDFLSLLQR